MQKPIAVKQKSAVATDRYQLARSQAKDRIRKMTAEQAQKYLDELIDKDPLLGINILKG